MDRVDVSLSKISCVKLPANSLRVLDRLRLELTLKFHVSKAGYLKDLHCHSGVSS